MGQHSAVDMVIRATVTRDMAVRAMVIRGMVTRDMVIRDTVTRATPEVPTVIQDMDGTLGMEITDMAPTMELDNMVIFASWFFRMKFQMWLIWYLLLCEWFENIDLQNFARFFVQFDLNLCVPQQSMLSVCFHWRYWSRLNIITWGHSCTLNVQTVCILRDV